MWRICVLLALIGVGVRAGAADEPVVENDAPQWGTVTGRVLFEGNLEDPLLDRFRGEIPLYDAPLTLREAAGLKPRPPRRQIGVEINRRLMIDESTQGVKNAVVYLRYTPQEIHPRFAEVEDEEVRIVLRDTRFIPRVRVMRVGQSAQFENLMPGALSNVHVSPVRNQGLNWALEPFEKKSWTPRRRETFPVSVQNDLNGVAKCWILPLDHPYAAVTAADGTFAIEDLPAGEHRLTIWHETVGYVEKFVTVTVAGGDTVAMEDCSLTLEQIRKKHQR